MKVPWPDEPEVYDNTPPWERKDELEKSVENVMSQLSCRDMNKLWLENASVGYKAGQSKPNPNVALGYRAGPRKIVPVCPQCKNQLWKTNECYICFACGSTYAIEED